MPCVIPGSGYTDPIRTRPLFTRNITAAAVVPRKTVVKIKSGFVRGSRYASLDRTAEGEVLLLLVKSMQ